MEYGESVEIGYHLQDPECNKMMHNHDVVFNEKKMHKTPIRDVETHRVTIHNVNPRVYDGRRQAIQALNVDQKMQPGTPTC